LKKIFITGTAGFIGFHLAKLLLAEGYRVHGYDGITDYYDVALKRKRHQLLRQDTQFSMTEGMLEDETKFNKIVDDFQPEVIIHLAAQAGVRYSLENPRAYLDSNVIGAFNVMEAARRNKVKHLMMASTSSVYGANNEMPFTETEKADTQLTIYAATKKANESMSHAYAHIYDLPITMFRFFTVYGTWGRPDLALYKFVDAILDGRKIDIYNHGNMYRDFTYVDDLVHGIRLLIDAVPMRPEGGIVCEGDSLSPVAPHRVVNIGNGEKIKLTDFIDEIEECLGQKAERNYMGMQTGDVPATWANVNLLMTLTGFRPHTNFRDGIAKFVEWYRDYSGK
jgi:UDP-glucuronate 4-epimerase